MPPPSKLAHSTAVFLGPSLPVAEARSILPADYFPPAARGDIYRIIASGVRTIVLIDGLFHGNRSVWQREILDAIDEGIEVYGASSMGALRAAELHTLGMAGHGTIFEWYRDGLIDGDDEVALLHGPPELDFCALSDPLVNIRTTLQYAARDRCMTDDQAQQLLDYARKTYYPERSFRHLLTYPALQDWPERAGIEQYVLTRPIDQKKLDAIGLLRYCADRRAPTAPATMKRETPGPDIWRPERLRLTGFSCGLRIVLGSDVLSAAEKDAELCARMVPPLLARAFVMDLARRKQLSFPDHLLNSYTQRWERTLDVVPDADWLRANGLTSLSYRRLLAQHLLVDWIIDQDAGRYGQTLRPEPTADGDADQFGTVVSMPRPALLAEWAKESGVSLPSEELGKHVELNESAGVPTDLALAIWLIERGPRQFGLDWCLESALLEELQITGLAAGLIAKADKR